VSAPFARPSRSLLARAHGIAGPLAEALRTERLARPELERLVADKLRALAVFAGRETAFWRDRFAQAGIDPARVHTIADLAALPVLTKEDLRTGGSAMLSGGRIDPAWMRNASGGSTGVPVTFYQDREYHRRMLADQERHLTWMGLPWWTPRAYAWGADRDSTAHTSWLGRTRDAFTGTLFLNTFRAADEDYAAFAERCAGARVPLLVGYASSLDHFARVVAHTPAARPYRPRAVQSSAERLTDAMRARIEAAFGAPVFDRYGSREMGNAAHECTAHRGLHVSMERVVVEVLRDGREATAGEDGELTVTVLDGRAQPLLRYATGDVARRVTGPPCPCGRVYDRIAITAGRTSDVFTSPSGRRIHGEYFTHLFYGLDAIAAFQVTQESRARIVLDLVRGGGDVEAAVATVCAGIRELDAGFVVEVRYVDAIPALASGKMRFTRSLVPVEWGSP
jgi:phenylacetate-CoA ligase